MSVGFLAVAALACLMLCLVFLPSAPAHGRRRRASMDAAPAHRRCRPKPEWVRLEVIRLKALMPEQGCRKLADTFNRMHSGREETVRKTYVS